MRSKLSLQRSLNITHDQAGRPRPPARGRHTREHWSSVLQAGKGSRGPRAVRKGIQDPLRQAGPQSPRHHEAKAFCVGMLCNKHQSHPYFTQHLRPRRSLSCRNGWRGVYSSTHRRKNASISSPGAHVKILLNARSYTHIHTQERSQCLARTREMTMTTRWKRSQE